LAARAKLLCCYGYHWTEVYRGSASSLEVQAWKAWKNNIIYIVMNWAQKFQNTGSVCDHCESRRI